MISPLRWPLRRIALLGVLWALCVFLTASIRPFASFSYQLAPGGYRIWSAFILMPQPWVCFLAVAPPVALLLGRALRR